MEKIRVLCSDNSYSSAITRAHNFVVSQIKKLPLKYQNSFNSLPEVKVFVDSSMVELAGQANSINYTIKLNYRLLKDNPERIFKIYIHELCHLIADRAEGRHVNHGASWKTLMKHLGQSNEACHNYDYETLKEKKATYKCNCSIHNVSEKEDKLILSGKLIFMCPRCRGTPIRK